MKEHVILFVSFLLLFSGCVTRMIRYIDCNLDTKKTYNGILLKNNIIFIYLYYTYFANSTVSVFVSRENYDKVSLVF